LLSYFWVRLTKTKKIIPKGLNVLVDSFILTDSFNKEGEFSDRYYTGYENYLSPEQISRIRYIPTLHGFRTLSQLISMSASAKKYKNKFIFQESWLSFYDYFFALFQTVILSFKIKNTPYFRGVNIHQLFVRESKKDIFSPSFMMAICKYRFIKKMRVEGVGVCHVLNWNENQNIDKALNLAIHEFYPGISVKGYQGYASSLHEVHKIPQEYELDNLTFPDELHVISKKIQGIVSSNCPKINVKLASAFRFSYLYDINRKKSVPGIPTILIALPMDIDESTNILNACSQLHSLVNTKISILVKHHPAHESHTFAKRVPVFRNDAFTPTNDSMFDLLGFISLLISSASSVCVEATSLGIPVAIHGNRHGVTMNPVTDVHNHKDNVFYSQEQLGKFVDSSLQKNSQKISIEHSFFMDNGESAQALFVCE